MPESLAVNMPAEAVAMNSIDLEGMATPRKQPREVQQPQRSWKPYVAIAVAIVLSMAFATAVTSAVILTRPQWQQAPIANSAASSLPASAENLPIRLSKEGDDPVTFTFDVTVYRSSPTSNYMPLVMARTTPDSEMPPSLAPGGSGTEDSDPNAPAQLRINGQSSSSDSFNKDEDFDMSRVGVALPEYGHATLFVTKDDGHLYYKNIDKDHDKLGEREISGCTGQECNNKCQVYCDTYPTKECAAWSFDFDHSVCKLFSDCSLESGSSDDYTAICQGNCNNGKDNTLASSSESRSDSSSGASSESSSAATTATVPSAPTSVVMPYPVPLLTVAPASNSTSNSTSNSSDVNGTAVTTPAPTPSPLPIYVTYPGKRCKDTTDNGKWYDLQGDFQSSPTAVAPDYDSEDTYVFATSNNDTHIWFTQRKDDWWSPFSAIPGSVSSAPVAVGQDKWLWVFARGNDGELWMANSKDSGKSWTWKEMGGDMLRGSAPGVGLSRVDDPNDAIITVVIVTRDYELKRLQIRDNKVYRSWRDMDCNLRKITSSPAVVSYGSTVEVAIRGEDSKTMYMDVSDDRGYSFSGDFKPVSQGVEFESPPNSDSRRGYAVVMAGVDSNDNVVVQWRNPKVDGNEESWWANFGETPTRSNTRDESNIRAPAGPVYIKPSPSSNSVKPVGLCTPCSSCTIPNQACWSSCQMNCYEQPRCAMTGSNLDVYAARRSCQFVWTACGTEVSRSHKVWSYPVVPANYLVDKATCASIVMDFCLDRIHKADLYAMTDSTYKESCGAIVYSGSPRCPGNFAYNMYQDLVKSSCADAAAQFYLSSSTRK